MRNNTFVTSSEHIWKRLDRTLPWAYNCRLCFIIIIRHIVANNVTEVFNLIRFTNYATIYSKYRRSSMSHSFVSANQHTTLLRVRPLYTTSCEILNSSHAQSNSLSPVADGDKRTKSSAYIRWLIVILPDKHPVLQRLRVWLRSSTAK